MAKPRRPLFERLASEHLEEVLAIEQAVHRSPWSPQSFKNEMTFPDGEFIVATEAREVIGYAGVWVTVDEAHITNIAVKPDRQRQGLGAVLLEELLDRARNRGAECATLEVRQSNEAALKLYEKFGFIQCGRRKRYYPDNGEDAIIMWLHELTPNE